MQLALSCVVALFGAIGFYSVGFLFGAFIALIRTQDASILQAPVILATENMSLVIMMITFLIIINFRNPTIGERLERLGLHPFKEQGPVARMVTLIGPMLGLLYGLINSLPTTS